MYHGTAQKDQKSYRDIFKPMLGMVTIFQGWTTVTRHMYSCEQCGHLSAFPEPALEPFYCHSHQCQGVTLVSIEPAPID